MPRTAAFVLLVPIAAVALFAADKPTPEAADPGELPRIRPLEPAAAIDSFAVRPGFRVELVASEPLVRDPVAVDFDEDGNLYVAEFPEYNQYVNPGFDQHGCVKKLTDTDGDGTFDTATVLADNVDSPVAVACWDGGVYVGVVPDLWYFKDTDGDGQADVREKVLTGFDRDKAGEGMLNSFRWGLDNRLTISTSLAGGELKRADKPKAKPVPVRRQNIRFDPRTRAFEPTSGGGQHGLTLDDWGDTFVCYNSNPIQYLAYDGKYLHGNPYVEAPSAVVDANAAGRYPKLHRLSPTEPWREARTRLRKAGLVPGSDEGGIPFGFFTGATGVTVYRGDAWPAEFHGDIFVGEVANNLIYRAKPKPDGLVWSAERAEDGREFIASRDIWFRPVQFANAPDGNLYVVDMYRELIEGAAFLPPQLLEYVDVAGGVDRGRIYRIVPDGWESRKTPKLSAATTAELVPLLAHPNGWHRDTAARLLYQRQDQTAVAPLRKLATESESALSRTHARYALQGLKALTSDDVVAALADADPRAREHGLRLAEAFAKDAAVRGAMVKLVDDPIPRVRYQLAFSLGSVPGDEATSALAKLTVRDAADPWVRLAVLCSATDRAGRLFADLIGDATFRTSSAGKSLLLTLTAQLAAANRPADLAAVAKAIDALPESETGLTRDVVRTLAEKLPPARRAMLSGLVGGRAADLFDELLTDARNTAVDPAATPTARVEAIRTLGLAPFAAAKPVLAECLDVRQPPPVQTAALETLAKYRDTAVSQLILAAWPGLTPTVRATAAEALFARPTGVAAFLDAVEAKAVRPADVDPARVQVLLKSGDAKLRDRAKTLFAGVGLSRRAEVIAKYQPALRATGDVTRGAAVFKKVCAACHKLGDVGTAVGPDLAAIKDRGSDAVLTNVLDPNREVLPQYYTYLVDVDDGSTITGMITEETANTLTLRKADGTAATVQRVYIDGMRSTGLSAMPEGLEQQIPVPAMADLLAYLGSIK